MVFFVKALEEATEILDKRFVIFQFEEFGLMPKKFQNV